jgi:hypothetical protein
MKAPFANRQQLDRGIAPAHLRRIKDAVAAKLLGAEYGTPIALMKLAGELTEREYRACVHYRTLHANYQAAIVAPTVRSQDLSAPSRAEPKDPFGAAGRKQARIDRRAIDQWWDGVRLIVGHFGRPALLRFDSVVLEDAAPDWSGKVQVVRVARALWGAFLESGRK